MYCPECRVEYRDGFTECADCHVALLAGLPPEPEPDLDAPTPDLQLVTVFECRNPPELALAKASLEEAAIPFFVAHADEGVNLESLSPFLFPWCSIQVAAEHVEQARAILEPLETIDDTVPAAAGIIDDDAGDQT